jgi:hypothetical protein
MKYKATALKDVTILAYVGGGSPALPERQEWISLEAGEVRGGLNPVLGVHPNSLPNETPTVVERIVIGLPTESWSPDDLPKEFFGLYRLERE